MPQKKIAPISIEELPNGCQTHTAQDFSIYALVPPEALQGWTLELIDFPQATEIAQKNAQQQIVLVVAGELTVTIDTQEKKVTAGDVTTIPKSAHYAVRSRGPCRFLLVYFGQTGRTELPLFDPQYCCAVYAKRGYTAHEIVTGVATNNTWSVALLEIKHSPKHYHKQEAEIFIVVHGELALEYDGKKELLQIGSSILINRNSIHQLKSAHTRKPVYVLCISFPAFDPNDFYKV